MRARARVILLTAVKPGGGPGRAPMGSQWNFDMDALVLCGGAMCLVLLYCFVGRFGMARKMSGKHSDSDDDY